MPVNIASLIVRDGLFYSRRSDNHLSYDSSLPSFSARSLTHLTAER
jgi:hypothetical protein